LNELSKEQENGITIANVAVKIQKIYSLNEAVPIIERLNEMYNEVAKKANEYNKINTKLSYDIIKLKQEVKELNVIIGRYKEKLENR
jgi:peptidoglycan hydrolase CwlO-like protein